MTSYPRRNQHGDLVPWLADWIRGNRVADQLQTQGAVIDRAQASLTELGRAVADQDQDPVPARVELLAQLQTRNRVERTALETAPEAGEATPEEIGHGEQRALDDGRGESARCEQGEKSDRNAEFEIRHFLAEARDDDHDWS